MRALSSSLGTREGIDLWLAVLRSLVAVGIYMELRHDMEISIGTAPAMKVPGATGAVLGRGKPNM